MDKAQTKISEKKGGICEKNAIFSQYIKNNN